MHSPQIRLFPDVRNRHSSIRIVLPLAILLAGLFSIAGCQPLSEKVTDATVGLNGGFEADRNGLPVNWLMYTPRTVDDAEFAIVLDRDIVKEGQQSLRFDVERCSSVGGWRSPGFTNEFAEVGKFTGPAQYKLSFWINVGCNRFH